MKRFIYFLFLICIFGVFASCKNTPIDKVLENKKENPENFATKVMPIGDKEKEKTSGDVIKANAGASGAIVHEEMNSILNSKVKESSASSGKPFYSFFEEKQKDFGNVNHVNMSYNAAPIDEIVPVFAKILDFDFYLDPNVKGVVTLTVDSNLSKKELWMVFEQMLLFTGAYCSLDSGIVHIQPLTLMSQERRLGPGFGYEANVSVVLFRLNNAKSTNLVQQLKPFMTNGAVLIDIADQNSILVVETPTNVPKLKAIVGMLDASKIYSWPRAVIKCINVPPTTIADELAKVFPVLGFPVNNLSRSTDATTRDSGQKEKVEAINLQGVDRFQLLVVSAANNEAIEEIKKWVDVLDKNDVGNQDQVFVYKVVYNRADDLVQALSAVFNVSGNVLKTDVSASQSSGGTPSLSGGGSGSGGGAKTNLATAYDVSQISSSGQSGGSNFQQGSQQSGQPADMPTNIFDSPVKILADLKNSRLVIRCLPKSYAIMKALLERIDSPPPQVLLTVTVADIALRNQNEMSLQTQFKANHNTFGTDYGKTVPAPTPFPSGTTGPGGTWVLNTDSANATFKALTTMTDTTMLANPEILVQNDIPALISIGESTPVQTGATTGGGTPGTTSSYSYKDSGIIIKMTPHIVQGGLINIEYNQTVSTVIPATANSPGNNPSFTQKVLQTSMVVPDGGTIVIGGLIQNKVTDTQAMVPFASNIPLIREIFGSTSKDHQRVEMLVLITANIVTKSNTLEEMSERYKNSVKLIKDSFTEDIKTNNTVFQEENFNKVYIK